MSGNEYHFITEWRIPATVAEVVEIITNGPDLARWWPSVYLDVQELASGDETGLGKVVSLYTKGWLPYTLRWQFRVSAVVPQGFTLQATGDFVGRGIWTFAQDSPDTVVTYGWRVQATKPLLRYLSPVLNPIFAANHRWAMAKGEESLKLELARPRASTPEEQARVPLPPGPTTTSSIPLLTIGLTLLIATILGLSRLRRWRAARR